MANLFVLSTVDEAEVGAKPSPFATPTFFHTVSGMDRYASANKGLWSCWKQTVDCIYTFVLITKT